MQAAMPISCGSCITYVTAPTTVRCLAGRGVARHVGRAAAVEGRFADASRRRHGARSVHKSVLMTPALYRKSAACLQAFATATAQSAADLTAYIQIYPA